MFPVNLNIAVDRFPHQQTSMEEAWACLNQWNKSASSFDEKLIRMEASRRIRTFLTDPVAEKLDLHGLQLTKLPDNLFANPEVNKKLKSLNLRDNCLSDLPQDIGDLAVLDRLYLSHNLLKELPERFGELSAL